jgi:hypothetical protein
MNEPKPIGRTLGLLQPNFSNFSPWNCLSYSILSCPWTCLFCSSICCLDVPFLFPCCIWILDASVLHQPVLQPELPLNIVCMTHSSLCYTCGHICSTAFYAASACVCSSVQQQTVLPLNVFVLQQHVLPLDVCLFYGSLCCIWTCLIFSSLCSP